MHGSYKLLLHLFFINAIVNDMEIFEGQYEKLNMFGCAQDCVGMHLPMELIFTCD